MFVKMINTKKGRAEPQLKTRRLALGSHTENVWNLVSEEGDISWTRHKMLGRRKEMMCQKVTTFVDEDEPPSSGEWTVKENGDDLSSIAEDASKIRH